MLWKFVALLVGLAMLIGGIVILVGTFPLSGGGSGEELGKVVGGLALSLVGFGISVSSGYKLWRSLWK